MKYNYLLPLRIREEKCTGSETGKKFHLWFPVGEVKAMLGQNYAVDFHCKRCDKRYTEIYSQETFEGLKKIIEEALNEQLHSGQ